jgi:hypothetical protein
VRKHINGLIVVGILAVAFVAAVDALRGPQSNGEPRANNPPETPSSPPAGSTEEEVENPCADTRSCWARDVALAAGFRVVGDTGSAWVIRKPRDTRREILYFWATPGDTSGLRRLRSEGYRRVGRLGEIAIFGDGVRFAWKLRRVTAWVEADGPLPKLSKLNPLVATSSTWPLSAASDG